MDIRKAMNIERDLLNGNLNRMSVTRDPEELDDMYDFAKKRLEKLYTYNKERLEEVQKLREVFK